MNWDKSTSSDIINNIKILSDKLIHIPITPSYAFHSKKQLAYLLKATRDAVAKVLGFKTGKE